MTDNHCPGCHKQYTQLSNPQPNEFDIVVCCRCAELAVYHNQTFHPIDMEHKVRRRNVVIDAQCRAFARRLDDTLAKLVHPSTGTR